MTSILRVAGLVLATAATALAEGEHRDLGRQPVAVSPDIEYLRDTGQTEVSWYMSYADYGGCEGLEQNVPAWVGRVLAEEAQEDTVTSFSVNCIQVFDGSRAVAVIQSAVGGPGWYTSIFLYRSPPGGDVSSAERICDCVVGDYGGVGVQMTTGPGGLGFLVAFYNSLHGEPQVEVFDARCGEVLSSTPSGSRVVRDGATRGLLMAVRRPLEDHADHAAWAADMLADSLEVFRLTDTVDALARRRFVYRDRRRIAYEQWGDLPEDKAIDEMLELMKSMDLSTPALRDAEPAPDEAATPATPQP